MLWRAWDKEAEPIVKKKLSMRSGRAGRGLAAVMLAIAAVVPAALAAPAVAATDIEPGDAVWVGPMAEGYGGTGLYPVYIPVPADTANPGTADYWAYCIEHDVSRRTRTSAVVGGLDSYLGENYFTSAAIQAKVYWVITHSYPALSLAELETAVGVTGLSANDAIEATQDAIWRYTDLTWDAAWPFETPNSEAVYWYLVNGANADTNQTPPTTADIDVSVTGPAAPGSGGALVGPFTISTNQATATVTSDPAYTFTDAAGDPIDATAVVDGQRVYLDLRGSAASGSATVTATVAGADGTGHVISTPAVDGGDPADRHSQSQILVAGSNATTSASAPGAWVAAAVPAIGTTLTDAADEDHALAWDGGSLVDTVAYSGLTVGQEYTLAGELMLQSGGSGTGITGETTFTPTASSGTVEVSFTVPVGYAGEALVAFETLYAGDAAEGTPVAEHKDITDVNQTVTVDEPPLAPAIGTTLLDSADQDHALAWDGGSVIDTIAYTGLTVGQQYTVSGELMRKSDGSATGITAMATFTPISSTGSVAVTFTVQTGHAGESLVAFETLYTGATASGTPVAEHKDINDAAQTVTVDKQPVGTGLAATGGALPTGLTTVAVTAMLIGMMFLIRRNRTRGEI